MRNTVRILGKSILLLFAGGFAGTILLILAYMLPINEENAEASFNVLKQEGWYPRASESLPTNWDFGTYFYITDRLDGYTDEIMLQTALNLDGRSPLLQAMSSYSELGGEYTYYWHGYVILLRPLLLLFDISNLRMFNCMCQLALFTALLFLIGREKGRPYAAMLLTSYLFLMPMALFMALQYSWVYYVAAGSTLVLLSKKDFLFARNRYIYFFIIIGMLTSYLDLLTYPLFTWGVPMVWWLVLDKAQKKRIGWCLQVVFSGISWIVGYTGMWIFKWMIASIYLNKNVFKSAINEVFYRSGTAGGAESYQLADRFRAFYFNWMHYEQLIFAVLLVIWIVYWMWKSFRHGWNCSTKGYAYLLVGASSFVWYFVLVNHTTIHHSFTYRIFGVTLLASMAVINDGAVRERVALSVGTRFKVLTIWAGCVLLAVAMMMLAREELTVSNGAEEFHRIPLEQEGVEVPFTPTFNEIKGLKMGLESDGVTGEYEISLWEGERLKYKLSIPVQYSENDYYRPLDVDWKLKHGKTYRLMISVKDNSDDAYVWVTTGAAPLIEYGELRVGETVTSSQLLTGISYWCRPVEKTRWIFLTISWTGFFAAVGFTVLSPVVQKRRFIVRNS